MEPQHVSDDVRRRMEAGEAVTIVDARSAEAWRKADSQISGSIRVPPDQETISAHLAPRDRDVVTRCT